MSRVLWAGASLAVLGLLVVVVPGVFGQTTVTEDFEDDTVDPDIFVDTDPSEDWYTYTESNAGGHVNLDGTGLDGTSQSLRVRCTGCGSGDQVFGRFTHDLFEPGNATFWVDIADGLGTLNDNSISFQGVTGTNVFFRFQSSGTLEFNPGGGCTGASSSETFNTPFGAHKFVVTWDWGAATYAVSIDDGAQTFTGKPFCDPDSFGTTDFCVGASAGAADCGLTAGNGQFLFDEFSYGDIILPPAPTAPAGLSALVTDPKTTTDAQDVEIIELTWPVSSNDPDQDQGNFTYDIFVDGINIGPDATTAADGDGTRFHRVETGGNAIGSPTTFAVRATNETSGLTSPLSCSVNVDTSVVGDADTCGSGAPGGTGALDFTTDEDVAAGLAGFGVELMGDSLASKFLFGLILVTIVFLGIGAAFAALAGAPGLPAVIAGAVAAFGTMIFLVVAQIWSLGAAAVIILLATGVALALMRRLFFGGGARG